ncbi:hypothetical protein QOT17_002246 [Balamuthia mandrillaris]
MGTDIYFYKVLKRDGKVVLIKYKSGQSMGLAPSGKDSEAKAFWVSAVAEQDAGAFKWVSHKRVPSCPLTNHPIWRQPNGDILIKNFNGSMEDLEKLTKPFGRVGCYGMSGGGEGQPSEANVSFANAEEAQRAIAALNDVDFNGVKMTVISKNANEGPEWISHYDYPHSFFEPFIEEVKEVNVDYENDEETEEYLNTSATYEITFKDPSFCEHLHVGLSWWGR